MIRMSSKKSIVYELVQERLRMLNPLYYDSVVKNSNLTYDDIYSIFGMLDHTEFVKEHESNFNCLNNQLKRYENSRSTLNSHKDKLLIEAFQYDGVYQNMDLCKRFFYSNRHIVNSWDYFKMAPDIEGKSIDINYEHNGLVYTYMERIFLFKIKPIDLLYAIKERSKEEIEFILKSLIVIKETIDTELLEDCNYKNLDYEHINNNSKKYPHIVFNYISKFEDFILRHNIFEDLDLYMETINNSSNDFENKINKQILPILKEILDNKAKIKTLK